MSDSPMERYVGTTVITKVDIPSDRRGFSIPAGTRLVLSKLVGTKHCNLQFPTKACRPGGRAANQVPLSKLMTG